MNCPVDYTAGPDSEGSEITDTPLPAFGVRW